MPTAVKSRESFREYVELLRELHLLMASDEGETAQADAARDRMDAPWAQLDETKMARVRGLSADLYTLEGEPVRRPPLAPNPTSRALSQRLVLARAKGNWDDFLRLLREAERFFPAELPAYLRGSIWLELGFPSIAVLFFERASRIAPENTNYAWIWLNCLVEADRLDEAAGVAEELLAAESAVHPKLVFKAVDVLFVQTRKLTELQATPVYQRLAEILERTLHRAKLLPPDEMKDTVLVAAFVELGMCYEHLRNDDGALAAYDEVLSIQPSHEAALTARGILRYSKDANAAVRDLERALLQDTPLVWPYFYLAHHSLVTARYQHCLYYCRAALVRKASDPVKADLLEWQAIAIAETNGSIAEVLANLDAALRLAPGNRRIEENKAEVTRALNARAPATPWHLLSEGEVEEVGRRRLLAA